MNVTKVDDARFVFTEVDLGIEFHVDRLRRERSGDLVGELTVACGILGAKVFDGDKEVGVVTTASYSRLLMQSLAMVHLHPSRTNLGTRLTIGHGGKQLEAQVVRTPFYDPLRQRTHPEKQR